MDLSVVEDRSFLYIRFLLVYRHFMLILKVHASGQSVLAYFGIVGAALDLLEVIPVLNILSKNSRVPFPLPHQFIHIVVLREHVRGCVCLVIIEEEVLRLLVIVLVLLVELSLLYQLPPLYFEFVILLQFLVFQDGKRK